MVAFVGWLAVAVAFALLLVGVVRGIWFFAAGELASAAPEPPDSAGLPVSPENDARPPFVAKRETQAIDPLTAITLDAPVLAVEAAQK